jgi:hypothetical protein
MRVPGLVVADDHLIESIRSDASLDQLANGTTLPGIVKAAMAMPDSASRRASRDSNRWRSSKDERAPRGTLARCPGHSRRNHKRCSPKSRAP